MVIRNILLIGCTGGGKSALGNLLINKEENFEENGEFEEIFTEGRFSVSETRDIKDKEFEHEGIKYRIIDTVGFGDTRLTSKELACKMIEACCKLENGLNQILFVVGGKFTQEERKIYKMIKRTIFDENIVKYTTIVRTRFDGFRTEKECQKDCELLKKENRKNAKLINSCRGFIHVNNPSLNSVDFTPREIVIYKETKKESKKKLLDHLKNCGGVYNPERLRSINEECGKYASRNRITESESARRLEEWINNIGRTSWWKSGWREQL